ncbi:ABC transporter ATP-binding protein [Castellaniella sp. S9]|uniref:ABC transporter ATP-binding protein n=1 Tax=Castellaniella sp. S9 TaxID=2993652 RepID=UPI0022B46924|nr:ATP-binding cassette domain-containing protein [Castellaniella sp. S9]
MSRLRIEGLTHRYGLTEVLSGVGLRLPAGQTLALVGPSGCGKSTLLHLVAGLLVPSEGVIDNQFRNIACMFQQARLMPWKNAIDNIALGLKAQGMAAPARRARAAGLARALGLDADDLRKYPQELSGGMQSRVALGRALAIEPDLLLLDEPFSALDVGLKLTLYRHLRGEIDARGTAVLMITHDLMEAVRLADRIVMMAPDPGRMVHEFPLQRAHALRDDAWVYQTTGTLMQARAVRLGFGLDETSASQPVGEATTVRAAGCAT